MFWGLTLEHGSVYSQVVDRSFHLSTAALGFGSSTEDPISVCVEVNKAKYVLCTLQPGKIPQQSLDHEFTEGEEICFYIVGKSGEVHLTGFLVPTPAECEYELSGSESDSADSNDSDVEAGNDAADPSKAYASFLTQFVASNQVANASSSEEESDDDYMPDKKAPRLKALDPCTKRKSKQPKDTSVEINHSENAETSVEHKSKKKIRQKKRKRKTES